jgi:undecaprenyl-diphosphatase
VSFWEALILGVVQGATEFLPVSSSGHLVIGQALLGVELPGIFFEVAVHVATLLSVLLVYRQRVAELFLGALRRDRAALRYLGLLVLASVPAGVVGVFFKDLVEALFENPWTVVIALVVTGALLWSTRAAMARRESWEQMDVWRALVMGLAQAFAIVPGISRSGSTVVTGLWLGVDAKDAAAFSFLMSMPAIGGAALLQVPELMEGTPGMSGVVLLVAAVAAAVTGVLAIRTFLLMLQRRTFHHFSLYCWTVAGLFAAWLLLRQ